MKLGIRVGVFVVGAALLFFGWRGVHTATVAAQNSSANTGDPSAVLAVIGGFVALLAFAPSPQTLGRWMSLKRKHHAPPAHFRRRRGR